MFEFYHNERSPASKLCAKCKATKPLDEYSQRKDGKHEARCKECIREADRERNHKRRPRKTPILPKSTKEGYKICNTCLIEKSHNEFSPDSAQKDGYTGRCKECRGNRYQSLPEEEKERIRRQDVESRRPRKELINARDRLRHNTDEHNAKRREQMARKKATDDNFQEAVRQAQTEWRKNNPLYTRESNRRHKIRQKTARSGGRISYKRILERDGYFCYICEKDIDSTIKSSDPAGLVFDHKIPLHPRKGEPKGEHTLDNIHPAHKLCNERKLNRQFDNLPAWDRRGVD